LEKKAALGDAGRFQFPVGLQKKKGLDFSFSGLKTAVRTVIENQKLGSKGAGALIPACAGMTGEEELNEQTVCDICASFQAAVIAQFEDRVGRALVRVKDENLPVKHFVMSGGVAANKALRVAMEQVCEKADIKFMAPPISYCTDNGVMIAWAGMERFKKGMTDGLDFAPRPRWDLTNL
jgi:N6-L-threonylcarbamoyladenine synthase